MQGTAPRRLADPGSWGLAMGAVRMVAESNRPEDTKVEKMRTILLGFLEMRPRSTYFRGNLHMERCQIVWIRMYEVVVSVL